MYVDFKINRNQYIRCLENRSGQQQKNRLAWAIYSTKNNCKGVDSKLYLFIYVRNNKETK